MKKLFILPILFSTFALASCNLLMPSSGGRKKKTSSEEDTSITSTTDDPTSDTSIDPTTSGDSGSSGTGSTSVAPGPYVNSVTLNQKTASVKQGGTLNLTATVDGNVLSVTWKSSNTSLATVTPSGNNASVKIASNATVGQTVTITATSTADSTKSDSCTITILKSDGSYTILVYMCGADLESGYASNNQGLASSDLLEMLAVNDQPDNVNIVIETGGASQWSANPGVNANYLQRYHIRNKQLVFDNNQTKANMGLASTLQSFITWGVQTYPADTIGLIFWDHGGAVSGACFDENYPDDYGMGDGLLASEMKSAYQGAFNTLGINKLEWVGYDCCIMSYADLAAINSQYFNYMVSSQELESGYGWDYDAWLPTLFNNTSVSTETLLSTICDTFVAENGGTATDNDQCLSVLDLTKMSAFTTAFDTTFAGSLTSSDWSKLKSTYNSSLRFANISEYGTAYGYGLADMKDFLTRAKNSYSYNTSAALTALDSVTIHSAYGGYYSGTQPCGLNVFIPADSSSNTQILKDDYGANDTLFTNWRNFVIANGTFYESSGGWGW